MVAVHREEGDTMYTEITSDCPTMTLFARWLYYLADLKRLLLLYSLVITIDIV